MSGGQKDTPMTPVVAPTGGPRSDGPRLSGTEKGFLAVGLGASDLQNILNSTGVATLLLDTELNVRFFTPAIKALFKLLPGDVGRPLADLNSLAADGALLDDAQTVLRGLDPVECEIQAPGPVWFLRRISPYRTQEDGIGGVVITFTDITERKGTREALEAAKRQAEMANVAKSRFLAVASHDLRQPLQSLALLQGLLAKSVEGERARELVERLDQTLGAMAGMLNTMLDINQIEAGLVSAEITDFEVNRVLRRMRDEFVYQAQAQKVRLRVVACGLTIRSDPRLLKRMMRNLVSNALKYTKRGTILLGCRRLAGVLRIEVWDTGIGIPAAELNAIFDEYHQIGNDGRERNRGLGLGLSIVHRLGELLEHGIGVRSQPGKGSLFFVEVPVSDQPALPHEQDRLDDAGAITDTAFKAGTILIVEDDLEVLELLESHLTGEGHRTIAASDGIAAAAVIGSRGVRPDLVLADYNLPNATTGLEVVAQLRDALHRPIPAIILTGDISTATLREIAGQGCVQLNKPVRPLDLGQAIQRLLPPSQRADPGLVEAGGGAASTVFIVDDDASVRAELRELLEEAGLTVEDYADCESFLVSYRPNGEACLLIDAYLPGMNGVELLQKLRDAGHGLPAIMITGRSDIPIAVEAMKAGACEFIEKPVGCDELMASVHHALELSRDAGQVSAWRESAADRMAGLTSRQRQILELVLAGHPSKNIAADLGISQRTVENHRAAIMRKTGTKSLPVLARLAVAAERPAAGAQISPR